MPEDSAIVRQKTPGPTCVAVNVFTGRVIAYATAADETTAKSEAERVAQAARRDPLQEDEARSCPGNCTQTSSTSSAALYGNALLSACADADAAQPVWVAYHSVGWRTAIDCRSLPQYANLNEVVEFKALQFTVPTVCPGTRVMSGCVIAMAIAGKQSDADTAAKDKAKTEADDLIASQRQTQCPAGCTRQVNGATASNPIKLKPYDDIPQARAGGQANGAKRYVAYYAAAWQVEIRCMQPPPGGGDDDDGGEGEMFRSSERGTRGRR